MKTLCAFLFLFGVTLCAKAQESPKGWIEVTVTNTVPKIIGTNTVAKTFVFTGVKTGFTNNTSRVWIQQTAGSNIGGFAIMPGQVVSVTVDTTRARRMDFYIHPETTGDGVAVELLQ